MTRLTRDFGTTVQKPVVTPVSADVIFASSRFPNYKIGAYNLFADIKNDPKILSMKEVVARETAQLLEHQQRLSVRDLANKFEKGLAAAAKLSDEVSIFLATIISYNKHWLAVWTSEVVTYEISTLSCHLLKLELAYHPSAMWKCQIE